MMHKPRGFTIFFASLVTALALSIGLAIFDLTVRELDLSATANQSQYAIYAADTGAECALYWDSKCTASACYAGSVFATSSKSNPPSAGVLCNTQDITAVGTPPDPYRLPPTGWTAWDVFKPDGSHATTTFWLALGSSVNGACAKVEVGKSGNPSKTTIISHGFNTCAAGSLQRVERALQVNY